MARKTLSTSVEANLHYQLLQVVGIPNNLKPGELKYPHRFLTDLMERAMEDYLSQKADLSLDNFKLTSEEVASLGTDDNDNT